MVVQLEDLVPNLQCNFWHSFEQYDTDWQPVHLRKRCGLTWQSMHNSSDVSVEGIVSDGLGRGVWHMSQDKWRAAFSKVQLLHAHILILV